MFFEHQTAFGSFGSDQFFLVNEWGKRTTISIIEGFGCFLVYNQHGNCGQADTLEEAKRLAIKAAAKP